MKCLTLIVLKIIMVIVIIIIFSLIFKNYFMKFIFEEIDNNIVSEPFINENNMIRPYNTRISYYNIGEEPWNRHTITSSVPYDINVRDDAQNAFYYEFNNETYHKKLKELFKSNCEELIIATEGNKWSKWMHPKTKSNKEKTKLMNYYEMILSIVYDTLNSGTIMNLPGDNPQKQIQIVHDFMKRYRQNLSNKEFYLFDIEMILYREGKLQGKHVKLYVVSNGIRVNIIALKIIGVVCEDNIILYPYVGNDTLNNIGFDVFIPEGEILEKSKNIGDTIVAENMDLEIENIMYKKLIEDYDSESLDISNSKYNEENENLFTNTITSSIYNEVQHTC
jgi:hypothetical protein